MTNHGCVLSSPRLLRFNLVSYLILPTRNLMYMGGAWLGPFRMHVCKLHLNILQPCKHDDVINLGHFKLTTSGGLTIVSTLDTSKQQQDVRQMLDCSLAAHAACLLLNQVRSPADIWLLPSVGEDEFIWSLRALIVSELNTCAAILHLVVVP